MADPEGRVIDNTTAKLSFQQFNRDTGVLTGVSSNVRITSGTMSGVFSGSSSPYYSDFNGRIVDVSRTSLSGPYGSEGILNAVYHYCSGAYSCFGSLTGSFNVRKSSSVWYDNAETIYGPLDSYVGSGSLQSVLTVTHYVLQNTRPSTVVNPLVSAAAEVLRGTQTLSYSYLSHSNASFDPGSDQNELVRDVSAGAANISLYNLGRSDTTTKLDSVSYVCTAGDCAAFNLSMGSFDGLEAGAANSGTIGLATKQAGHYSATFSLLFADDNAIGVASTQKQNGLTLFVNGDVAAPVPEPSQGIMLLAGLAGIAGALRRRKA